MTQPPLNAMPYTGVDDSRVKSSRAAFAGLTYRLSYRDLVALMAEWGVHVSHTTIMRWVHRYVSEYEERWDRRAKPVGSSWCMDETYIQTRPKTGYLAGIELAHRIRKRQFKFGPGRWICWSLKKQWEKALA